MISTIAENKTVPDLTSKSALTRTDGENAYLPLAYDGDNYRMSVANLSPYFAEALALNGVHSDFSLSLSDIPRVCTINEISGSPINYSINGSDYSIASGSTVDVPSESINYVIILTTSNTLDVVSNDDLIQLDQSNYLVIGFIEKSTVQAINFGQQDLASANTIEPNSDNWAFYITDTTNDIQLIDSNGFARGNLIALIVKEGQTIIHDYSPISGSNLPLILSKVGDFTATKKTVLFFTLHDPDSSGISKQWFEVGASTLTEGINGQLNIIAQLGAATGAGLTITSYGNFYLVKETSPGTWQSNNEIEVNPHNDVPVQDILDSYSGSPGQSEFTIAELIAIAAAASEVTIYFAEDLGISIPVSDEETNLALITISTADGQRNIWAFEKII